MLRDKIRIFPNVHDVRLVFFFFFLLLGHDSLLMISHVLYTKTYMRYSRLLFRLFSASPVYNALYLSMTCFDDFEINESCRVKIRLSSPLLSFGLRVRVKYPHSRPLQQTFNSSSFLTVWQELRRNKVNLKWHSQARRSDVETGLRIYALEFWHNSPLRINWTEG